VRDCGWSQSDYEDKMIGLAKIALLEPKEATN
jgi:hypothetical protein